MYLQATLYFVGYVHQLFLIAFNVKIVMNIIGKGAFIEHTHEIQMDRYSQNNILDILFTPVK